MEMSEIFSGLVNVPVVDDRRYSVRFHYANVQCAATPAPFFISRPVEKEAPNTTGSLLERIEDLERKLEERNRANLRLVNDLGQARQDLMQLNMKLQEIYTQYGHLVPNSYKPITPHTITNSPNTRTLSVRPMRWATGTIDGTFRYEGGRLVEVYDSADYLRDTNTFRVHDTVDNTSGNITGDVMQGSTTITFSTPSTDTFTVHPDTISGSLDSNGTVSAAGGGLNIGDATSSPNELTRGQIREAFEVPTSIVVDASPAAISGNRYGYSTFSRGLLAAMADRMALQVDTEIMGTQARVNEDLFEDSLSEEPLF